MRTKKTEKPTYLQYKKYAKGGNLKTYKNKYNIKYGYPENESHNLEQISKDTGVSLKGLQEIYNKGIGAYKTNPESVRPNVNSKEQWAMARVYSAVMGGKASKVDSNELKMAKGGLIAPNGKQSNLTPEQYKLVRTAAFKKWFGDFENDPENSSKVVDENGEPLVVYHGTDKEFNVFDLKEVGRSTGNEGHYGYGFYFADSEMEAKTYGKIILKCFLNIKKPFKGTEKEFDLLKKEGFSGIDDKIALNIDFEDLYKKIKPIDSNAYEFMRISKQYGIENVWSVYLESNKTYNDGKIDLNDLYEILTYTDLFNQNNSIPNYILDDLELLGIKPKLIYGYQNPQSLHWVTDLGNNSKNFTDFIKSLKYDGVIYGSEYVAFESNQIKLSDGSNTTFDGNNPDIRYAKGGEIKDENGYLKYSIEDDELIIDNIKVNKQRLGTGKKLINQVKEVARRKKLPITLYAYPQDDTINEDDLKEFYYSQGFDLHPDDVDGSLFIYGSLKKYSNGGLTTALNLSLKNLKNNGIVLRDSKNKITLIAYNSGGQERNKSLYNKAQIYRSIEDVFLANEIISLFDSGIYDEFDENEMKEYLDSNRLIICSQNEVVYDNSKFGGGGLVAPNGKASNLTPEQYKLVRTAAFKKWFGDWENDPENSSQIKDENGEPLVVYRGFNSKSDVGNIFKFGVNRFKQNRNANRFGHYFTRSKKVAQEYSEQGEKQNEEDIIIKSYFLNSKNPVDLTINNPKFPNFDEWVKSKEPIFLYSPYRLIEQLEKREIPINSWIFESVSEKAKDDNDLDELSNLKIIELKNKINSELNEQKRIYKKSESLNLYQLVKMIGDYDLDMLLNEGFDRIEADERRDIYEFFINYKNSRILVTDGLDLTLKELIIKNKYDSVLFLEWQIGAKSMKDKEVYVVFQPEQIKLADGTNTTFDGNNPDIRYEDGGEIQSMINEGIVEIEFYDTTIAHAKEYGIESKKPLYLKRIFVSENNRMKGIGKKLIKYLYDFAIENGNDVIFGHIATKASYIEILKHLLLENGYTINDKNNDFYIMITKENQYNIGGDLKKSSVISLPDTYSSYDSLKPILENQGYELIKKTNSEMLTENLEIEDDRSVSDLDNKYPNIEHAFINKQLMSGIEHEMEHTDDPRVAKKIAIDHLLENIHYYEYLAEMEQKMKGKDFDEHYEAVTKLYADGGTVDTFEFQTPTGEPSKLNYLQQVLVRTKAFKNFFGDWELAAKRYKKENLSYDEAYLNVSKCVDMLTLEPKVVYHGTQADKEFFTFDVTQERKEGRPYAYFAYNREYSLNFSGGTNSGYMYAVFLNIRNPFNAQSQDFSKLRDSSYWLTLIKKQITIDKYGDFYKRKELDDAVDSQIKKYIEEVYSDNPYYFWILMARDVNKDFKYFLLSHGYDGIFANENYTTVFDVNNPSQFTFTYIAFNANEIKLADGRNIDFDPMNSDIRYEEGGKTVEIKENVIEMQPQTEPLNKIESLRNQLRNSIANDNDINQKIFKSGGHVEKSSGSPDDAKDGGLFVGRSHANGGIKAINLSTNQPIEVEGGEVIITKPAVDDQTKREFEGKMMTNKEILSHINQSGGGVSFAKGGEMCGCSGKMYKFGGETLSDYMVLRKISNLYDESVTNVKNYVDNLTEQLKHI